MKKASLIICSLMLLNVLGFSQNPCLPTWGYRVPVIIDNTTNPEPLVDYQLKMELNTDSLINLGQLKADGGDLRITNAAGIQLPFWVVNNTMNTTNTEIWVNVDNIPPNSTIDIYLFYGRRDALSVADGDATFLHYDNFEGTALDFGKWNFCGGPAGGTIPVVSGGEVTLGSSSGQYNHLIKSAQNFTSPVTTEMKVNAANNGIAYVGQVDAANNGYGMAIENVATVDVMRLVSSNTTSGDTCLKLVNQSPTNSVNSGIFQGLWSFSWSEPNEQLFSWPGGSATRNDFIDSTGFSVNNKNVVIGSFTNTGSVSVDYVYTRKYSPIVPTYSINMATELVDEVDATTNAPVCVGDTLKLFSPSFVGAVYNWVGPNGYISTDQNPVIPNSTFVMQGKYIVTVSAPTNCSAVSDSVVVALDSVPVAGTLLADTTVCLGANSITLRLSNKTGRVTYWESANTIGGPWNTITNTTDTLVAENLVQTQFYRAIVEFGTCGTDTSNISRIKIDLPTVGGNVIGTSDACFGFNDGNLNLINLRGVIQKWESSIDFGATWLPIATTSSQVAYNNLTDTTWYRVLVKNGVCDSAYSDTAVIFVQPLPLVNFSSASACFGTENIFVNNSSITSGTIDNYFWEFTNGNSSTDRAPRYQFNGFGNYNVFLRAISDKGCIDSTRVNVAVNPLPQVSFTQTDVCDTSTMLMVNTSTIATGTIDSISWNYGDGMVDTARLHKYISFGAYQVNLTAFSDSGCVDSVANTVRVLQRAVVDFTVDSVCLGENIAFVNNSNSFQDSTVYSWNFGDGSNSTQVNPSKLYATPDTFEVVLQASTYDQCINTKVDTVIVYPLPQTNFTFNNECQYDSIQFNNNTIIDYGSISYAWDFGDSTTSAQTSPKKQYLAPANYSVKLVSTSNFGCTTQQTLLTEVFPIPDANFVFGNVCRDTTTPITNTSTIVSGTMNYLWNFDDATTAVMEQPNKTFVNDGTYNVKLVVTSNNGCLDSITKGIVVNPIPKTNFIHDTICNGNVTALTNTTTINKGFIQSYFWNRGDTTFTTNNDANHTYQFSGTHNVTLRAISDKGCLKDTTITILVDPFPTVDFEFDNECVFNTVQFNNKSTVDYGTMIYDWKFGNDSISTLTDPTLIYNRSGFYPVQLTATTDNGCVDSTVKVIEIYALPLVDAGLDTTVSFGFHQELKGIAPTAVTSSWSNGTIVRDVTSLLTEARPLENTEFTLTVTDKYGCVNTDKVTLNVLNDFKLLVTNTVTPNGDGANDTWKIENASSFNVVHVQLYDRWGTEVFKQDNYQSEFNGSMDLDILPDGTYHYLITFDESDRVYKGSLTVLR